MVGDFSDDEDVFEECIADRNDIKLRQDVLKENIGDLKKSVANMANQLLLVKNDAKVTSSGTSMEPVSYDDVEATINSIVNKIVQQEGDAAKLPANQNLEDVLRNDSGLLASVTAIVAKVTDLETVWSELDSSVSSLSHRLNNIDQYGRLYNLKLRHVPNVPVKYKGHWFTAWVVKLLNRLFGKHLYRPIQPNDIDKSHPLFKESSGKHTIIVRFVIRDVRDDIFYKRHLLNHLHTNIKIEEHLTKQNKELLHRTQKKFGTGKVKTDQAKIIVVGLGNARRTVIKSIDHLDSLQVPITQSSNINNTTTTNTNTPITTSVQHNVDVFEKSTLPDLLNIIKAHTLRKGKYRPKK